MSIKATSGDEQYLDITTLVNKAVSLSQAFMLYYRKPMGQ